MATVKQEKLNLLMTQHLGFTSEIPYSMEKHIKNEVLDPSEVIAYAEGRELLKARINELAVYYIEFWNLI